MKTYTKESLELLRSRIDLIEVLSPYVNFSRSGVYFKACCPFHEEKTPSFTVQRTDTHYHCFGCSAHGDAISFLMNHQKMTFTEAVEHLADKFNVSLDVSEDKKIEEGPSKKVLKEVLETANRFYHYLLLHSQEGNEALKYLYERGIDIDFIKTFQIGLSSKNPSLFQNFMKEKKITSDLLHEAGLIKNADSPRDFFSDRIMFPIRDPLGSVIGFSARKYKEETFGPKYVNTAETHLFKKSKILFGLNYSRKNIAKQRKVIIVEGQIDALRLIHFGFTITVASQGTAFTENHMQELINLGVNQVYLVFDSDTAGVEAAVKTGDLFQKNAIETYVVSLPPSIDPDKMLIEYGPKYFEKTLSESKDYLTFLVDYYSKKINIKSPAGKNELVLAITSKIKNWDHPLMVHESLRKLASLMQVPEMIISDKNEISQSIHIKQYGSLSSPSDIDPDLILETDLLRILFSQGSSDLDLVQIASNNLSEVHFKVRVCKNLYAKYLISCQKKEGIDLLSLAIDLENPEERIFMSKMLEKKINNEKLKENFIKAVQQILDRFWMEKREEIKLKIQSGTLSDDEVLDYAKKFDEIKNNRPKVIL
ncbi:MAG: DNA primase [Parachlamydiales bacterium]